MNAGLIADPYALHFVSEPVPRSPVLNRGYFARMLCFQHIVQNFLNGLPLKLVCAMWFVLAFGSSAKQVVSLGCGFDTLYFRLYVWLARIVL